MARDEAATRELFSRWAARYDDSVRRSEEADAFPFAGHSRVLDRICDEAAPLRGTRVLELGVGTGALAERLVARGAEVTGVDCSQPMLDLARSRVPSLRVVAGDLWDRGLLRGAGRFDRVVGSYALHERPSAEGVALLRALRSTSLNPGGLCVFGDLWFATPADHDAARARWQSLWDPDEHYWAMSEVLAACAAVGLAARYEQVSFCAGVLCARGV